MVETLVCDHSNQSYRAVLSRGTVYKFLAFQPSGDNFNFICTAVLTTVNDFVEISEYSLKVTRLKVVAKFFFLILNIYSSFLNYQSLVYIIYTFITASFGNSTCSPNLVWVFSSAEK